MNVSNKQMMTSVMLALLSSLMLFLVFGVENASARMTADELNQPWWENPLVQPCIMVLFMIIIYAISAVTILGPRTERTHVPMDELSRTSRYEINLRRI
ncbi:MAG: hypothetical protein KKE24_06320 [Candidatus Thermoplasmatota archaeon]|nr:hypothetical protein [Candidatus Thermoplasmatota archaeon]